MIIQIGETEWHDLKRQFSFPKQGECKHARLQYMEHGELLLCRDCQKQVSAIWALRMYFTQYEREKEKLEAQAKQLQVERETQVVHRAALKFQEMVRKRKYFPTCPHCYKAIELDAQIFGGSKHKEHYKDEVKPLVMKPNITIVEKDDDHGH